MLSPNDRDTLFSDVLEIAAKLSPVPIGPIQRSMMLAVWPFVLDELTRRGWYIGRPVGLPASISEALNSGDGTYRP